MKTIARLARELTARRREIKLRRRRIDRLPRGVERTRLVRYQRKVRARAAKVRKALMRRRRKQTPKIVDAGLRPANLFGSLGPITAITGHYTAGPRDRNDEHALDLFRAYDSGHRANGWGGIGYHYGITAAGTIVLLRPVSMKGAHVGGWNTGNVGVVCHGTTGDAPTAAQVRAWRWLLDQAHTPAMPVSHRAPVRLRGKALRGHNDWPSHTTNSCPGGFKPMYRAG